MKSRLVSLAAVVLLAVSIGAASGTASAARAPRPPASDQPPTPVDPICFDKVAQFKYQRSVETFKTQHEIDKYVRTSTTNVDGTWINYGPATRWEPTGSHLAWVDTVPAANWQQHGAGNGWV